METVLTAESGSETSTFTGATGLAVLYVERICVSVMNTIEFTTVGGMKKLLAKLPDDTAIYIPDSTFPKTVDYQLGYMTATFDDKDIKPIRQVEMTQEVNEGRKTTKLIIR